MLAIRRGALGIEPRVAPISAGGCLLLCLVWAVPGAETAWADPPATADAVFRKLDASGDGLLTMDEATVGTRSLLERVFKEAGKRSSEPLTRDEFRTAYDRLHDKAGARAKASSAGSSTREVPSAGDKTPAGGKRPEGDKTAPEGWSFIDVDGDGAISKAEWSKFTQSFSRLDADKDGSLDAAELQAIGGAADVLLKLIDANGDGKVARLEWAPLVRSFQRWDANRDGSLAEEELRAAAEDVVAAGRGTASLPAGGEKGAGAGPTLWRGRIEGRSQIELLITGDRIEGREIGPAGGDSLGAGTFTMTGNGKSGNMDAVYTDGPRAGQVCLGIYRLEGNTVLWCVNNRGVRPQELAAGPGNWLLTLTRVENGTSVEKPK